MTRDKHTKRNVCKDDFCVIYDK